MPLSSSAAAELRRPDGKLFAPEYPDRMLWVGLIGTDRRVGSVVADRLGELGAVVPDQCPPWRLEDPTVVVRRLGAVPRSQRPLCQLVIGAGDGRSDEVDAWIDAADSADQVREVVDTLWTDRIVPFEANLRAGRRAPRRQQAVLFEPDPSWPDQAGRLIDRLAAVGRREIIRVDHIGSTSVPELAGKQLVDIQVVVADLGTADRVAEDARRSGFVHVPGQWFGLDRDAAEHPEEVVVDADPGRPANVNIRPVTAPVWRES